MDKRRLVFFALVLMIVGLTIMLVIANITNKIVIARNNIIIRNSLKNMDNDPLENEFEDTVNLEALSDQYTAISLSASDKIKINRDIKEYKLIERLIELREYSDSKYHLNFLSGVLTDEEFEALKSYEDDEMYNKYILKINKVYAVNNQENVFDVYIDDVYPKDEEKIDYYENPDVVGYMKSDVKNTYKLRIKKIDDQDYKIIGVYCYDFKY